MSGIQHDYGEANPRQDGNEDKYKLWVVHITFSYPEPPLTISLSISRVCGSM
jgi:hypothetical protein